MKPESPDLIRLRELAESYDGRDITPEMIEAWQGSDNLGVDDFLCLLADIANGDYPLEAFRLDVIEFHDNNQED